MIRAFNFFDAGQARVVGDYHANFSAVKAAVEASLGSSLTVVQNTYGDRLVRRLNGQMNMWDGIATYDLWNNELAGGVLYNFMGGTAGAHKFNWLNPVDTNAGFRLFYAGSAPTHSATGLKMNNDLTGYCITYFAPNTIMTTSSGSMGIYIRTSSSAAMIDLGCENSTSQRTIIHGKWSDGNNYYDMYSSSGDRIISAVASTRLQIVDRTSTTLVEAYRDGGTRVAFGTNTVAGTVPSQFLYLGADNFNGFPDSQSNREYCFAYAGRKLGQAKVQAITDACNECQTAWSRNV